MLAPGIAEELEVNPSLVGKSVEPLRFTDMDLAEREASIGRSTFALQFMLDTSYADADRHPLKLRDLVVCHLDSENGPERVVWAAAPEWTSSSNRISWPTTRSAWTRRESTRRVSAKPGAKRKRSPGFQCTIPPAGIEHHQRY